MPKDNKNNNKKLKIGEGIMKLELDIPDIIINQIQKVKPDILSIKEYLEMIIKNEVNSRFDDL